MRLTERSQVRIGMGVCLVLFFPLWLVIGVLVGILMGWVKLADWRRMRRLSRTAQPKKE